MKTVPAEILSISAIELSRRLHAREVTAVDLLKMTLDRIDEVNPKLHAIISLRKGKKTINKIDEKHGIRTQSVFTPNFGPN